MNRSVLKILCIVSGILFATLAMILVISAVQVSKTVNAASVGIIGGADGPTAMFLMQEMMRSPVIYTTVAAGSMTKTSRARSGKKSATISSAPSALWARTSSAPKNKQLRGQNFGFVLFFI